MALSVRPIARLVECRNYDILLPVIQRARVRDASALDILEPPDGDGLRSGQQPQQVEVSEWDGSCPTMWARKTFASKFFRLPGISRLEGRSQPVMASATSSAYCGLCPRQSFHSKCSR